MQGEAGGEAAGGKGRPGAGKELLRHITLLPSTTAAAAAGAAAVVERPSDRHRATSFKQWGVKYCVSIAVGPSSQLHPALPLSSASRPSRTCTTLIQLVRKTPGITRCEISLRRWMIPVFSKRLFPLGSVIPRSQRPLDISSTSRCTRFQFWRFHSSLADQETIRRFRRNYIHRKISSLSFTVKYIPIRASLRANIFSCLLSRVIRFFSHV